MLVRTGAVVVGLGQMTIRGVDGGSCQQCEVLHPIIDRWLGDRALAADHGDHGEV